MSEESKGTIEPQFRNMKSTPGLEIGLRPELGTFELCDGHYDASKTESPEYCAVCKLEARIKELEQQLSALREAFGRLISVAEQCDGWEFFPSEDLWAGFYRFVAGV